MRIALLLTILSLIFVACRDEQKTKIVDLEIPDKVFNAKTMGDTLLPGTRIYTSIPKGYHLRGDLLRIVKDDNPEVYFQFAESQHTNFKERKPIMLKDLESMKAKGLNVLYQKEFLIGKDSALLIYGSNVKEELSLIFGNQRYTVMVIAQYPAKDSAERQTLLRSMWTCYVDETIQADEEALKFYTIDVSKSEFKYNSRVTQMFYYTIGGKGDPVQNPFETSVMIANYPPLENFDKCKEHALDMLHRYKINGIEISSNDQKEIQINGEKTYEIQIKGSYQGKPLVIYQTVTGNERATITFIGNAYERQDEMVKQFKALAQTLKIK